MQLIARGAGEGAGEGGEEEGRGGGEKGRGRNSGPISNYRGIYIQPPNQSYADAVKIPDDFKRKMHLHLILI